MAGLGLKPGKRNTITDVPGLSVGQASDEALKSGVTVVVGDEPMVAGVHVMGGAPGTRETDLLRPDATVDRIDALVLSGGSAFGLAAATGVSDALAAAGRGFPAAGHVVPIVPAAILFDLANGGDKNWAENPYPALGRNAYEARGHDVGLGSAGAGTGATVADLKGGQGTASAVLPTGGVVGALVAVNALGQVTVGEGPHFWAAPWEEAGEFGGGGPAASMPDGVRIKAGDMENTSIAIVATDLKLSKSDATRVAIAAHDGIARSIVPSHTPMDGDLIFACSTGQRVPEAQDIAMLGHAAATCLARAIARGVYFATPSERDPFPTWRQKFG
ncbi:MAG: P1 family peptidase [Boseongicola sp.]